jgi:hypothetical protein
MRLSHGSLLATTLLVACGGSGCTSTSHDGSDASLDGTIGHYEGGSTTDASPGADGSTNMDSATGAEALGILDGPGAGTQAGDAGLGPDGSVDGGMQSDASPADAIAPPCVPILAEAGTASTSDAEVPLYHRATAACCPSQRGPGPANQPYPPGVASFLAADAGGCTSDSDCTDGVNGRCFPFEGAVGAGGCSYDDCFTDSNCGSATPCLCRSSSADNSANVCDPGGNCAVDSDCGPGSYCSPSPESCYGPSPYYCHTSSDTCVNDADCPFIDAGECCCPTVASCVYSPQAQRWACNQLVCCPP